MNAAELARRLLEARRSGRPIELLSEDGQFSEEFAYSVQELVVEGICADGRDRPAGYKIAMTSPETMALARASQPAYGVLTRSMVLPSPAELGAADLYQGRIEAELVFRVESDLPPEAEAEEIVASSLVAAGLELPSARYRDWFGRMPVPDLVGDNTAAGRLVVGTAWVAAADLDLAAIGMRLRHDGVVVQIGLSSAVLGSPALALAWLREALARRRRKLRRGDLVSSGTFGMPLPIQPGRWDAEFDGVGTVRAVFG